VIEHLGGARIEWHKQGETGSGDGQMRLSVLAAVVLAVLLAGADAASAQNILVTINKSTQKMVVQVDGERQFVWPVSTGAPGYDTPSGTYRPFRMEVDHFSEEWDDAPMPHSIFFTPEGHAIHGSPHIKRLGTRASHGCVRLAPDNAAKLYAMVEKAGMNHTTVVVKGGGLFDWDAPESAGGGTIVPPSWFEKKQAPGVKKASTRSKSFFPLFRSND
jgi:L,D-transpeptidase catalytic domain